MTIYERLPYMVVMILSALLSGRIALIAYRSRRKVARAASFAMMASAGVLWILFVTLDMATSSLAIKELLWCLIPFAILNTLMALFFFSLEFSLRLKKVPRPVIYTLASLTIFVTALSVTNPLHHQMWTVTKVDGVFIQVMGNLFPVQLAYTYLLAFGSISLLVRAFIVSTGVIRRQTLLLLLGVSIPVLVSFAEDIFGWNPLPYLDESAFSLVFTVLLFGWATLSFNTFYLLPVASDVIIKNMKDGVLVADADGLVIFSNAAVQKIMNRPEAGINAQPVGRLLADWLPEAAEAWTDGKADTQLALDSEPPRYFRLSISQLAGNSDEAIGSLLTLYDNTEQKNFEQRLNELAVCDPLTGSYNRRYFYEMANAYFNQMLRSTKPLSILMIDLDHFKHINDNFGHTTGDQVLQKVALTCRNQVRTPDIFSRYGGEEFVLALPETSLKDALMVAERLRKAIEALDQEVDGIPITASFGVAVSSLDSGLTLDALVHRADEAMYKSKHAGRNRVTAWQES
ncbi:MAG TPA: diguanylate cyclase [Anaerolineales bacterium]|jgi:diguanylate cyclase (GGDEF)-like protein